jgi:hypothetical protein
MFLCWQRLPCWQVDEWVVLVLVVLSQVSAATINANVCKPVDITPIALTAMSFVNMPRSARLLVLTLVTVTDADNVTDAGMYDICRPHCALDAKVM